MVPAKRLYQLLLIGTVGGLAIALLGGNPTQPAGLGRAIALTLAYDAGVLALALVDAARVRSHRIRVVRQTLSKLSIGRENPITLTITATEQATTSAQFQLRDAAPAEFATTPLQLTGAIAPSSSAELTYTVRPSRRGAYSWGDLYLRQLGAWGLAWHEWRIPQAAPALVYPDLIGLKELSAKLMLQASGNVRQARRMGMGTEFTELRDYSTGDDPRLIDWKATARRNQVLVRVLEPEQEQTLIILLDRGRLMTAQVQGLARFDWGMNAALSLALAALNRGDRVGLGVFDREMTAWVPPERGQPHLTKLLNTLTPLEPVMQEPDYVGAVTTATLKQARRALIVVLTDLVDETASSELLLALGRLKPRHLPFCVLLRDAALDKRAQEFAPQVAHAYRQSVALDLLAQRQLVLATLRQRGVLVLDAPAQQLSNQLVDRYLQVKARNLL